MFTLGEWLVLVEHELLLFAGVFFLIGALDELLVDAIWLYLKTTGRAKTRHLGDAPAQQLRGEAAVFIAAWREATVIGTTVRHALTAWPHAGLTIYVGTYRNDPLTAESVAIASMNDPRVRLVVHDCDGPSTKADCLNRLYRALEDDERRSGRTVRMVVIQDAEDMVDPVGLDLLGEALDHADLGQLPVLPEPLRQSRWVASHYCEEFAEAHGKGMVVRAALGAGFPTAGVGCAISRPMLERLARRRGKDGPFSSECLTEDYELGLGVAEMGGLSQFIRARHPDGRLVATRACFPARLDQAVRQKTRWMHGIALQSWDRLGWSGSLAGLWMRMRDRRGPLMAVVLATGYFLVLVASLAWLAKRGGWAPALPVTPAITALVAFNTLAFVWRALFRFAFTAREYGWGEGARAVLRVPLANVIAIMSGRRALAEYTATLRGREHRWDKTIHTVHPALVRDAGLPA